MSRKTTDTTRLRLIVVTKSDVGMGAPYVVGVFTNPSHAEKACRGAGTFTLMSLDPNRVYARGTLLDCCVIDNLTGASVRVSS